MVDITKGVIKRLKQRDEKAFDIVYDQYYKLVYYVAYEILNDAEGAEDILQETFIKLMGNIEEYEDKGQLKQYLTTIARNLALNEYKRRKTHEKVSLPEEIESQDDYSQFNVILTLNKVLTKEEGQIVKYKVLYDYSFQEIANETNKTLGTIQSQYYIAIKKLKKYYQEKEGM